MKKYLSLGGALFAAALLLGVVPASALTVQPVIIDDISLNAGETVVRSIKLTNESSEPVILKSVVYDAEPSDNETGFPKIISKPEQSTLVKWFPDLGQSVSLQAGETKTVALTIAVPNDAEPGGHYGVLSWGPSETASPEGIGAGVAGQVGVNLALDVKGQVIEKGDLVSFTTSNKESRFEKLPIEFTLRVNNSGNRHFKPRGTVTVSNMLGSAVAVLPVNAENAGGNILPKDTRAYAVQWDGGLAFGKYTAKADLSFGKAGSAQASYDVWVLPTGLMIMWLIFALIVILILALLVKNLLVSMKKKQ